jgi:hypothetical protein
MADDAFHAAPNEPIGPVIIPATAHRYRSGDDDRRHRMTRPAIVNARLSEENNFDFFSRATTSIAPGFGQVPERLKPPLGLRQAPSRADALCEQGFRR